MNAAVSKMVLEANRRDLDELVRGRYLDEIGVRGHVAFGFYVDGFGEAEAGSLCNAGVIPSERRLPRRRRVGGARRRARARAA